MYLSTFTTYVLIDIYYICTYQHVLCECLSTSKPTIINLLKINNYSTIM